MSRPCLIAHTLEAARLLAEEAGAEVAEVTRTAPPRESPQGELRVVRERWEEGRVRLVVAARLEPVDHGAAAS